MNAKGRRVLRTRLLYLVIAGVLLGTPGYSVGLPGARPTTDAALTETGVVEITGISGGFGITIDVINHGPDDAASLTWSMDVSGGVWFGNHAEGPLPTIPTGSGASIKSGFFFGMGPVELMVRAGGSIRHAQAVILGPFCLGCTMQTGRTAAIPDGAFKGTPANDRFPPVVHDESWGQPVPMPGSVNTAGGEDACFITSDNAAFYFFFTPDVSVPAEQQLLDGVTGIWQSRRVDDAWTDPERVLLSTDLALDGAPFVSGDTLWFASFRVGNYGTDGDMWTARNVDGRWARWENAGETLNGAHNIGEMHLSADGRTLYFHREEGGHGGLDLWTTSYFDGSWTTPVNLGSSVNSPYDDSRPWVSPDETELWFTRPSSLGYVGPAVYRSVKHNGVWSEPEEIISNFAGEPTLDVDGNIYFVHHFFSEDMQMLEADIYVAYKA
jgi:hypothetical protein